MQTREERLMLLVCNWAFFSRVWRLLYFLSTGLGRKNIYIKEYAFFDRAHSTKYTSQKDEIWERLLLLFELSLFSANYLLLSVAAPYGVSLIHGVIQF